MAHEALIRHWPRLRGWLDEDRAALGLREGIRQAALEWEAGRGTKRRLVHRGGAWRTPRRWPSTDPDRDSTAGSGRLASAPLRRSETARGHAPPAPGAAGWLWRWR